MIRRFPYLIYRLLNGLWRRVLRRFTLPGFAVLSGILATGLVGLDTQNTVAYQAFALLMFLLLSAFIFGGWFRASFSISRRLPRFATAGQPFSFPVSITNLTSKTQRGLSLLENSADHQPSFAEWEAVQRAEQKFLRSFRVSLPRHDNPFKLANIKEAPLPPLPPHGQVEVRLGITPLRRGTLRFSGVSIGRPDPLGLLRATANVPAPQTVLILPKRYLLPPIALPGSIKFQQGGVTQASNVGQSDEFVGLRDYRRGDPLRHIHWRTWAKVGKPIVKEFEDEFFVRHALVLDTFNDDPYSELFEEAVSVAASFACSVLTQESLLDLLFVGSQAYCFTAGRGLAHVDQMLEVLASVRACDDRPFASLEGLVFSHLSKVSGCVCVLLAWDAPRREFVGKLKSLGVPVLVFVIVPAGSSQPLDLGPMRDDPTRLRLLEVGRVEQGLASLS